MKTFKTLIRKSDGQYVTINSEDERIVNCNYPVKFNFDFDQFQKTYPKNDWTLYDLIEVAVVKVSDIPNKSEVEKHYIEMQEDKEDLSVLPIAIRLVNWYRKQIFK